MSARRTNPQEMTQMTRSYRRAAVATLTCLGLAAAATGTTLATTTTTASAAPASASPVRADFNHDGYADIAVGVPGEDLGSATDAGSVQILYGAAKGFDPTASRVINQNTDGVADVAESGDRFGAAVAIGDFNGDSYSDLAVGVPGEDFGGKANAGVVQVFFGSASGLRAAGGQLLNQDLPGSADPADAGDRFGSSLAAGNIAGSREADLAVGVPYEDVGSARDAGAVHVLRGAPGGLTTSGDRLLTQNTRGAADRSETGDHFGAALAVGNMGAGAMADLAVGVPLEDIGSATNAGAVQFFPGTVNGVSARADRFISQNSKGIADKSEKGDHFGAALAVANIAGSSYKDLAVGIPLENIGRVADAGAVALLRGAKAGLGTGYDQFISQNTKSVADKAEKGDRFGSAVAAANFGGTSKADLAIGVPLENLRGKDHKAKSNAGAVEVIPGGTKGLNFGQDRLFHQDLAGSEAAVETGDHFGAALATANVVGSSFKDLVVGVPYETADGAKYGGSIQVFRGATAGLTVGGDQVFTQSTAAPTSFSEAGDHLGAAVAAG